MNTPKALLALAGWLALSFVINLLFAKRSQLDHWAEANPRIAALLKLMRAVGIDPWMMLQAASLFVRGRLPPGMGGGGAGKDDLPPTPRDPSVKIVQFARKPMPDLRSQRSSGVLEALARKTRGTFTIHNAIGSCLAISFMLLGCSGSLPASCAPASDLPPLVESCHARINAECPKDATGKRDEACPALKECSDKIEAWRACK